MNQENLISECVNGDRERNCAYCPAHPSKGGKCCFGTMHTYGDPDCNQCALERDCSPLSHQVTPSGQPRMIRTGQQPFIRPSLPVIQDRPMVRTGGVPARPSQQQQQLQPLLAANPHLQPEPMQFNPNDSLFSRFAKVVGWGMIEGGLELGANFFRRRRPE